MLEDFLFWEVGLPTGRGSGWSFRHQDGLLRTSGLTRAKKTSLLMVLVHPEIPLHNNSRNWTQDSGCESGRSVGLGWLREPVGHLHVPGWDHPEVGSELLPLHQRPNFRGEPDTAAIQHHEERAKELNLNCLTQIYS